VKIDARCGGSVGALSPIGPEGGAPSMKRVPKIDREYWLTIIIASIFGANAGDYIADALGLGHLRGIPFLAAFVAVLFVTEALSRRGSALFYWATIIVIRAAATNIGDVFHDYRIGFGYSIPAVFLVMVAVILIWKRSGERTLAGGVIPVNTLYWITMFLAGVLGTVVGDGTSYGTGIGNLYGTIVLSVPLAVVLFCGRRGLITNLFYYWMTIALIRSAGTAAGDFLARTFGLGTSTALTGIIFAAVTIVLYEGTMKHVAAKNGGREMGLAA
jgi:uncharacterized membrane-anchored protein